MLATSYVTRGWRKRLTALALLALFLLAYWPVGAVLEESLSPAAYLLWVVVGIPAAQILVFGLNAYANLREDKQLEEGPDRSGLETPTTDGGGET